MASNFEKVMQACLESKKATAKKAPAKKRVTESKKATKKVTRKSLRESEELLDDEIEEVEDVEDVETLDPTDVADDIVVVVDPEMDAEELDDVAAEIQAVIDETPEGEEPVMDDYIDDLTYSCPICGNTFFTPVEMNAGDECPVCGEVPEDFVLVGQVASTEDVVDDEAELVDDVEGEEDLDLDIPDEDLEPAEPEDEVEECKTERKSRRAPGYMIDESTFNPFLTKFIRENYKNAHAFKMEKATINKATRTLKVECSIVMKSGAKKKVVLAVEKFSPMAKVMAAKDASGTFKVEGKASPFLFKVKCEGRVLKCEGLKYNYVTKAMKEGKKLQVSGNLIRESKKANFQRGRRK